VCFGVVLLALVSGPAWGQSLRDRIEGAIAGRVSLQSASVGVHLRDARTGDDLYSFNGDRPLIPASNQKLLTTGAALRVLGPDLVFETRLGWDGGRVVIIGDGDPGLGDPALLDRGDPPMTVDALLDQLAGAVAAAGAGRVEEIVIDDRIFDRERVHPSWPQDQLNKWYCAEVAGLNFHTNCVTFFLSGGEDGAEGVTPVVRLQPAIEGVGRWIRVDNKARTVRNGRHTAWIARAAGARPANEYTVFGDVRLGSAAAVDAAMHEPPVVFGSLLAERLAALGVEVGRDGAGRPSVRLASPDDSFPGFKAAAVVRTGMSDILLRANTNSQNLYTEALLKRVGHAVTREPGSWRNGAAVVRMLVTDLLGPEHGSRTVVDDGSGMSRGNLVAASTMTAWIAEIASRPEIGPAFVRSMAQPGEGTLRRRFADGALSNEVYAKSGSIDGVRCLSGVVIAPGNGRAVAFSVLLNDLKHGSQIRDALALHEDVVAEIDRWLTTLPPRAVERIEAREAEAVGG
jgi:D-alanyl-D-alanine carboxypeptidase/D-alanyl-D-alanine-endopeptidase (penicillin-binding protein 4)